MLIIGRGLDRGWTPCYSIKAFNPRSMIGAIDYGDDGVIPMIESDQVESVVENILEYVEARFEILDLMGGRDGDIMALVEEFHEWGTAQQGDEVSYFTCPTFE